MVFEPITAFQSSQHLLLLKMNTFAIHRFSNSNHSIASGCICGRHFKNGNTLMYAQRKYSLYRESRTISTIPGPNRNLFWGDPLKPYTWQTFPVHRKVSVSLLRCSSCGTLKALRRKNLWYFSTPL